MQIIKEIDINAPADKAWAVISNLSKIDQWTSLVHHAETTCNANHEVRVCETNLGKLTENILTYDQKNMCLAYDAKGDKLPFFVKHLQNSWKIRALSDKKCRVLMRGQINMMFPFNIFPGPLLKLHISRSLNIVVKEFKFFVENDTPAASKVKAIAIQRKKAQKATSKENLLRSTRLL